MLETLNNMRLLESTKKGIFNRSLKLQQWSKLCKKSGSYIFELNKKKKLIEILSIGSNNVIEFFPIAMSRINLYNCRSAKEADVRCIEQMSCSTIRYNKYSLQQQCHSNQRHYCNQQCCSTDVR